MKDINSKGARRATRKIARAARQQHRKIAPIAKRPTQALMRIPAPPEKPWQLNREERELVRQQIAKGSSDAELQFCLAVARRHKLDPFRGQIWFVPRRDGDNKKWIPIVGINGLQHIAARDHKDYGSIDEAIYGPDIVVKWRYKGEGAEKNLTVPEWASVAVWKKGAERPTVGKVFWAEVYHNIDSSPLVRQMPKLMIGKCAKAQALRAAYPTTDGLYIQEEFQGRPQYTDSGRALAYADEQPKQDDTFFCAKHNCDIKLCPSDEHTQSENEQMDKLEQIRKLTPDQRAIVQAKTGKVIDVKPKETVRVVPNEVALFYDLTPSGLYELLGDAELLRKHKEILLSSFLDRAASNAAKAKLLQPANLGKLIAWAEKNGIRIRALEPVREPGEEA